VLFKKFSFLQVGLDVTVGVEWRRGYLSRSITLRPGQKENTQPELSDRIYRVRGEELWPS
jgi:hypothetical protein